MLGTLCIHKRLTRQLVKFRTALKIVFRLNGLKYLEAWKVSCARNVSRVLKRVCARFRNFLGSSDLSNRQNVKRKTALRYGRKVFDNWISKAHSDRFDLRTIARIFLSIIPIILFSLSLLINPLENFISRRYTSDQFNNSTFVPWNEPDIEM